MKSLGFVSRLGFAAAGLKAAWRRERSFRSHCLTAVAVFAGLAVLQPPPIWWAVIALTVAMVIVLELVNSAIEGVIDLLHPAIHPEIKVIKDMAAGAVLVASIISLIVGAALVWDVGIPL